MDSPLSCHRMNIARRMTSVISMVDAHVAARTSKQDDTNGKFQCSPIKCGKLVNAILSFLRMGRTSSLRIWERTELKDKLGSLGRERQFLWYVHGGAKTIELVHEKMVPFQKILRTGSFLCRCSRMCNGRRRIVRISHFVSKQRRLVSQPDFHIRIGVLADLVKMELRKRWNMGLTDNWTESQGAWWTYSRNIRFFPFSRAPHRCQRESFQEDVAGSRFIIKLIHTTNSYSVGEFHHVICYACVLWYASGCTINNPQSQPRDANSQNILACLLELFPEQVTEVMQKRDTPSVVGEKQRRHIDFSNERSQN